MGHKSHSHRYIAKKNVRTINQARVAFFALSKAVEFEFSNGLFGWGWIWAHRFGFEGLNPNFLFG